jgi:uncharacterized protein
VDLGEMLHSPGMRSPMDVNIPCTEELELGCTSPIIGQVVFTNTGNLLVIQGQLRVTLKTECPRCLGDVETDVEAPVDEEFTVTESVVTSRADDDETMADPTFRALFPESHILDLSELARQSVVLATPMLPVCREDCGGLCPECGANLNETQCDCEAPVDSPFAALQGYYDDTATAGE